MRASLHVSIEKIEEKYFKGKISNFNNLYILIRLLPDHKKVFMTRLEKSTSGICYTFNDLSLQVLSNELVLEIILLEKHQFCETIVGGLWLGSTQSKSNYGWIDTSERQLHWEELLANPGHFVSSSHQLRCPENMAHLVHFNPVVACARVSTSSYSK